MPRPFRAVFSALFALWFLLTGAGLRSLHPCPVHDVAGRAKPEPHHADQAAPGHHGHHAAAAGSQEQSKQDGCTSCCCVGPCSTPAGMLLPSYRLAAAPAAVVIAPRPFVQALAHRPQPAAHSRPFATAPPRGTVAVA
jgi:hypothetical protein